MLGLRVICESYYQQLSVSWTRFRHELDDAGSLEMDASTPAVTDMVCEQSAVLEIQHLRYVCPVAVCYYCILLFKTRKPCCRKETARCRS